MEEARARKLRFLALQLVGAVAVVHLVVGGAQLAAVASRGLLDAYLTTYFPAHPRAGLFVVSGLAVLAGIAATARGRLPLGTAYRLGVAAMVGYLVGWVAWHTVLDHGLALGGGGAPTVADHSHGGLLDTLVSHYLAPLVAVVSASTSRTPGSGRVLLGVVAVTLELVAGGVLLALLRRDPRLDERDRPGGWLASLVLDRPEE